MIAVVGLSAWSAKRSRGGLRAAIVIALTAVLLGWPFAILADSFESSTLTDHDAKIRTYLIGIALLLALDVVGLLVANRRGRTTKTPARP